MCGTHDNITKNNDNSHHNNSSSRNNSSNRRILAMRERSKSTSSSSASSAGPGAAAAAAAVGNISSSLVLNNNSMCNISTSSSSNNGVGGTGPNVDSHTKYLRDFRVEQCPLFIQRKCTQHRPFTCFNWHFMNQRRRRPIRKRDRTFNYSADNYCAKYDETTGICQDGDECPNLHRTAGDTERRYHLRYYKTCMCVHDTDARGFCVKNGPHCAFAHGNHDLRPAVYDIKEIQAMENPDLDSSGGANGPNILDKERNLMNEDPKWQDTTYVLSNYKTEPCKRPPRLCRQGYACPSYHNSKDKRRSPRKYKYRSTPCPNVKHGEEWGEPGHCDQGDSCVYCHTRTEQQFHPEIYKSTKCNDVQQAGYCPRGVFCAFAHVDPVIPADDLSLAREVLSVSLDCGTNLVNLLSNALPSDKRNHDNDKTINDSSLATLQNGSGEISESASTSSLGSNGSHNKAPGAQLHQNSTNQQKLVNMLYNPSMLQANDVRKQLISIESDPLLTKAEKAQKKQNLYIAYNFNSLTPQTALSSSLSNSFYQNDTVESVLGNALDDLSLEDPLGLVDSIHRDTNSPISNSISAGLASSGLLSCSAPVNIPGMTERTVLSNFSPITSSPLQPSQSASSFLTAGSRFSHQDSIESSMSSFMNHVSDPFSNHISQSSSSMSKLGAFNSSLFDFAANQGLSPSSRTQPLGASPLVNAFSSSPSNNNTTGSLSEVQRLREELTSSRAQLASWDERINQARVACNAWQIECEESKRKAALAEQQRDEAMMKFKALKAENEATNGSFLSTLTRTNDLKSLPIAVLKSMQSQLRSDLEEVEKVLYRETATKCMVCEEQNRTVTLSPCNHYVVCSTCALNQRECPYCQTPVTSTS
ncbi:putative E3 ubiquitin-protein ligase UNKL isoform X2 [Copidosoma floridanum]|uniref:putative E3 ubiquitin-protein ligase UNKL isoform X2 n=1 Tax=Copidosoma floridanum TaxID=29053 RepID=UPI0006C9D747|nr:putative E3 ubiquitin-protein ligase UNKL isoform X2 [Copidosoma floridanum]